jgi:hypothetical protein
MKLKHGPALPILAYLAVSSTIACSAPTTTDSLGATSEEDAKNASDGDDDDDSTVAKDVNKSPFHASLGATDPDQCFIQCVGSTGGQLGA